MNYQKELEKVISKIKEKQEIPTLLLHVCCAPCSSYVLEYLAQYFKITILYYNPNIYPNEEYTKRYLEVKKLIKDMPLPNKVNIMECSYDNDQYNQLIKGLEQEKEGGARCNICFRMRLEMTAKLASENNFDYFTTTLSISPYKNALLLNQIGQDLSKQYNVNYLYADFKKNNGYKRSIELSKIYNLYRQNYCGCIYSKKIEIKE